MQLQDTPSDLACVGIRGLLKRGSYSAFFAFWFIEREVVLDSNEHAPQLFVLYFCWLDSNEIDRRFSKAFLHSFGVCCECVDCFA